MPMSRGTIWRITVTTTAEAEDAVTELLSRQFGEPASAFTAVETGVVTVAVYCGARPKALAARCAALKAWISLVRSYGLDTGPANVSVRRIRREDWAESWKRHFKPIEIGGALLVKPSWSKRRPVKDQAVVVLDPGLSFGTGQHPTTWFCLRELVRRRSRNGAGQAFLDIGTGSGILAIAAVKLGYSPVRAFDFDPEAVRVARANARSNGVAQAVQFSRADVAKLPTRPVRQYDFICANLISTLLMEQRRQIARQLRTGGTLVLAGILKSEFGQVERAYTSLGLKLRSVKTEKEWCSCAFCRV
jgi:ribosomal protein L11 methyltransferase